MHHSQVVTTNWHMTMQQGFILPPLKLRPREISSKTTIRSRKWASSQSHHFSIPCGWTINRTLLWYEFYAGSRTRKIIAKLNKLSTDWFDKKIDKKQPFMWKPVKASLKENTLTSITCINQSNSRKAYLCWWTCSSLDFFLFQ